MRYILDTDHVSIMQWEGNPENEILNARLERLHEDDYATTCVTFGEQAGGCNASVNSAKTPGELLRGYELMTQLIDTFKLLEALPFDQESYHEYQRLKQLRIRIGTMDLRIAAICKSRGRTLLTRNRSDFGQVPGLLIEDWTRPESQDV